MYTVEVLRKRFDQGLMRRPLRTAPEFVDDDLRLGADTRIFAVGAASPRGEASVLDGSGPRLLALLRAGYGVSVPPDVIDTVRRAATQWSRGEKALAHIHLAFARLPRLAGREAAFRLFLADELLRAGVMPDALVAALERDALEKFDPDQPRVPAGGRESGQWTSGGGVPASEPLLTGRSATTSDFHHACRVLGLDPHEASDALHAAKKAHGLAGDDNCHFDLGNWRNLFRWRVYRKFRRLTVREFPSRSRIDVTFRMWSDNIPLRQLLKDAGFIINVLHVADNARGPPSPKNCAQALRFSGG